MNEQRSDDDENEGGEQSLNVVMTAFFTSRKQEGTLISRCCTKVERDLSTMTFDDSAIEDMYSEATTKLPKANMTAR